MIGVIYSLVAGIVIAIQSVINTRLSEKAGFWLTNVLTNVFVHGSGLLVALVVYLIVRDGHIGQLQSVNKGYLLGGALGVVILFTVMKGISSLGPAYSIAILLVAQLVSALGINALGLASFNFLPPFLQKTFAFYFET